MPPKSGAGRNRFGILQILVIAIFFTIGFYLGVPGHGSSSASSSASSSSSASHGAMKTLSGAREGARLESKKRSSLGGAGAVKVEHDDTPATHREAVADEHKKEQDLKAEIMKAPDQRSDKQPARASVREDFKAGKQNQDAEAEHKNIQQDVSAPGRGLECPAEENVDGGQIPLAHLPRKKKTSVAQKYDRRAHNCASNGIWNRVTINDHHKILHNIVRLGKIKKNSFVFDWGSGCGHSMQFLYDEYNATGVGIDVSSKTINYSKDNTTKANMYCVADGTKLEWIPNNFFDHAFSFGSIYHVYNRTMFCHVIRQLSRIVREGGTVYNGWTENAEYKRVHVKPCLEDLPVSFEILEEQKEFANVDIFPLKSQQRTPNTYSLVVTKTGEIDATEVTFDSVPIWCGKHQCVKKSSAEYKNDRDSIK